MVNKWRYAPHFHNGNFDDWGDGNSGFMNGNGFGAGSGHLSGSGIGHGSGDLDGDGEPWTHRRIDDEVLGTCPPRQSAT